MYNRVIFLFKTAGACGGSFCPGALAASGLFPPWGEVGIQALNFTVFVLILGFIVLKKLPPVLKQSQADFLTYKKQARDLRQKHEREARKWQKDIERVEAKQRGLNQEIQQALKQLRLQMEADLLQVQSLLRKKKQAELARKKLTWLHQLKEEALNQIMEQTKAHLKQNPSPLLTGFLKDIIKQGTKTG